ncbi:hypothetical protein OQA88_3685 [Cercophora sp. LCS_1]
MAWRPAPESTVPGRGADARFIGMLALEQQDPENPPPEKDRQNFLRSWPDLGLCLQGSRQHAVPQTAQLTQTAAALEANLTSLESRLDELLATLGIPPEALDEEQEPAAQKNSQVDGDEKKKDA